MITFGSGYLYGISSSTNSTPRKFGTLQDVTFDFTFTTKELYGQQSFAVDVRRGEGKFTGKSKFANISGGLVNDIFFGQSATPGLILSAIGEPGSIPAATPYTVTVVNAATFDTDLGVWSMPPMESPSPRWPPALPRASMPRPAGCIHFLQGMPAYRC